VTERQELHCHNCMVYVQFDLDLELNGNHVLECPNCKHEHCRVVKDGKITEKRWDDRNTYRVTTATWTTSSTFDLYQPCDTTTSGTGADIFTYVSWMNSSTVGGSF
jgi:hypothetical protein